MSADVARGHGDGGGDDDRPPPYQVLAERKAGVLVEIGTQFDLKPHMESEHWAKIYTGIQQHLQKIYNGNKLPSGMILRTLPGLLKILKPGKEHGRMPTRIPVTCRPPRSDDGELRYSRVPIADPDLLLHTLLEEMLRLQGLGSNTETGVPYTEDEIMAIVQKGKQRGNLPGVGRVLPGLGTDVSRIIKLFRSNDKMSQMLMQLESQPEFGGGSGSGRCGDDESGDDEDGGENDEDEEDVDS
ncbi:hypothetical protein Tco_0703180 [Tanacetum coccineum]|uniref:Uncharacterized protein n=1 Tax=Tanacetum coccineum TaxID=301880 RepID=A0ABQ4XY32_9ASTR